MSSIYISAAHKSSGKTTVTIGLCAALTSKNISVQPFKKGPDYIDPLWLSRATSKSCYNLDFYTMHQDEIIDCYALNSANADICVIEGNKGLYDGLDLDGSNSNAALSKLLKTPVILVLDARGMTRGIAPLIRGYQDFDKEVDIRGVILNQLGGNRHESKLRSVIEHYTDVEVVGALHHDDTIELEERHLGLMPSNEDLTADRKIDALKDIVIQQVDIDKVFDIAKTAHHFEANERPSTSSSTTDEEKIRIGVIRNEAFGFYYPDDILVMQKSGAEIIYIDNIKDSQLPNIDGLFIGGGFPETHMAALEANESFRKDLHDAIEDGLPVYAECGGLMYLSRSIIWNDDTYDMVGVIDADISMEDKPQGRGYVKLKERDESLWPDKKPNIINAHEFHYSHFINLNENARFAYDVERGFGIDGKHDGYIYKNMLACYSHQRSTGGNHWTNRFINFVRETFKLNQSAKIS